MSPRPENHPDFYGPCGNADDPLKAILDRYDLCQREAFDSEQVARVNAMDPGDAPTISHFLHERLVFVTYEYGTFPGARAEDVLELCESDEAFRNGPMEERCDFEFDAARTGFRDGLGWLHTGEAGQVLVDALNALYGISGEGLCDRIGNNAAQALRVVIDASRACNSDADCVEVGRNTSCFDTCSDSIAASFSADVAAAKETLEENQCAAFERANCSFVVPPCTPLGAPTCSDGYCGGPPQAPEGSPVPEAPSTPALDIIVPPDADGNLPPSLWLGCENGPYFQFSDLDEIIPLTEGGPGGVVEAVDPFLSSGEGQFWPQDDWLMLRDTPDEILLVHADNEGTAFLTVHLEDGQWVLGGSQMGGPCRTRVRHRYRSSLPSGSAWAGKSWEIACSVPRSSSRKTP